MKYITTIMLVFRYALYVKYKLYTIVGGRRRWCIYWFSIGGGDGSSNHHHHNNHQQFAAHPLHHFSPSLSLNIWKFKDDRNEKGFFSISPCKRRRKMAEWSRREREWQNQDLFSLRFCRRTNFQLFSLMLSFNRLKLVFMCVNEAVKKLSYSYFGW